MAKPATKKHAFGNLLRIAMPFNPKALAYYDFEMGLSEYGALGYATVQWAFLEEMLYIATARLYRRAREASTAARQELGLFPPRCFVQ